jgi:hypothetical protein
MYVYMYMYNIYMYSGGRRIGGGSDAEVEEEAVMSVCLMPKGCACT